MPNSIQMIARCMWRQWHGLPVGIRVQIVDAMRANDIESVRYLFNMQRERDIERAEWYEEAKRIHAFAKAYREWAKTHINVKPL